MLSDEGNGVSLGAASVAAPPGVAADAPEPRARLSAPAGRNWIENGAWLVGGGMRATSKTPDRAWSDGSSLKTIVALSADSTPGAERSQLYDGLVDHVPALAGCQVPSTGQATTSGVPIVVLGATFSISVAGTLEGSTGTSSIVPGTMKRTAATAFGPVGSPPTCRFGPLTVSTGSGALLRSASA